MRERRRAIPPSLRIRSFTYPYTRMGWGGTWHVVPMVNAQLSWSGEKSRVLMLMDTGANRTFLLSSMAKRLGLVLSREVQATQAGGGILDVRQSRVDIALMRPGDKVIIGRKHRLDPVLVVREGTIPFPILGRQPFLSWYDLSMRESRQEFTLRERS